MRFPVRVDDIEKQYKSAEKSKIVIKYSLNDLKEALPSIEDAKKMSKRGESERAAEAASKALQTIQDALKKADDSAAKYVSDVELKFKKAGTDENIDEYSIDKLQAAGPGNRSG